jgi:hypothetical protein
MRPSTNVQYCKYHDEWFSTECCYCLRDRLAAQIKDLLNRNRYIHKFDNDEAV